jgi:hypothetical protein
MQRANYRKGVAKSSIKRRCTPTGCDSPNQPDHEDYAADRISNDSRRCERYSPECGRTPF